MGRKNLQSFWVRAWEAYTTHRTCGVRTTPGQMPQACSKMYRTKEHELEVFRKPCFSTFVVFVQNQVWIGFGLSFPRRIPLKRAVFLYHTGVLDNSWHFLQLTELSGTDRDILQNLHNLSGTVWRLCIYPYRQPGTATRP